MRSYRKNSHSKYDLKVHLIWIPKYRKRVLIGKAAERARDLLKQICMDNEVYIISGKVACDHVHMFVEIPPKLSVSEFMRRVKGGTSRKIQ